MFMEIISKKQYDYPIEKTRIWNQETFQPLSDLKLSLRLDDGHMIECAYFRMIMDGREEQHACISTQVGCRYGCRFCTSGRNGFLRNLSKKEMREELEALLYAGKVDKFDCLLFMGIGEPLENYGVVVGFIKDLIEKNDLYSGLRKIALATIGIPDLLEELSEEKLPIDIWISLHASSDRKRKKIMPFASRYSIANILKAAENYYLKTKRFVWINYMLFVGFNNLEEDAQKIAKLLAGKKDIFKFIITEPNNDLDGFRRAVYSDLLEFENKLRKYGVQNEIVRFMTAGKDIGAGCGEFIFMPKRQ